jgi:abequosyltransferase
MGILLSIAIPTYNRSKYLDLCLGQIHSQIGNDCSEVEVIVSNNHSDDDTADVVNKYRKAGMGINYLENRSNMGADLNIAQCYNVSKGKYLLVLGDDDVLLNGSIDKILDLLRSDDYGLVFLSSYSFKDDYLLEQPASGNSGIVIYEDLEQFVEQVNYMVTFLSANIVNKSKLSVQINPMQFAGTNLLQLEWILPAMFNSAKNVCINDYMVAAKRENSGGYQLCQVFGVNLNRIFDSFANKGINQKYFRIINRRLLRTFFPHFIRALKALSNSSSFKKKKYFRTLFPVFGLYLFFWLITVPAIFLSPNLSKLWQKICEKTLVLFQHE